MALIVFFRSKITTINEFIEDTHDGYISTEDLGIGMHKCFTNAAELIEDAKLLLEKRPGRSISLTILSIEELGKIILLMEGIKYTSRKPEKWIIIQKKLGLKKHIAKQDVLSLYGKCILDKIAKQNGKEKYYDTDLPYGLSKLIDWFKQLGFYTEFTKNGFISPNEFGRDNKEWALYFLGIAEESLNDFRGMHEDKEHSILLAELAAKAINSIEKIEKNKDENEDKGR